MDGEEAPPLKKRVKANSEVVVVTNKRGPKSVGMRDQAVRGLVSRSGNDADVLASLAKTPVKSKDWVDRSPFI